MTICLFVCGIIVLKGVCILQSLGDRIKLIRLSKGMNKTEFGKLFGATGSLVNKWENHGISPSEDRLRQIAEFGGYSVEALVNGDANLFTSVDCDLKIFLDDYVEENRQIFKQEVKLLTESGIEGLLRLIGRGKGRGAKAVDEYEKHRERIKDLEKFGEKYIEDHFENYTYEKYLQDFPSSDLEAYQEYKKNERSRFKTELDNYWLAFDIPNENFVWINNRFTEQIADELDTLSKKAIEEGKEHYYVNEVVQPFLDQAAKDFKEYISDYIDTED